MLSCRLQNPSGLMMIQAAWPVTRLNESQYRYTFCGGMPFMIVRLPDLFADDH